MALMRMFLPPVQWHARTWKIGWPSEFEQGPAGVAFFLLGRAERGMVGLVPSKRTRTTREVHFCFQRWENQVETLFLFHKDGVRCGISK